MNHPDVIRITKEEANSEHIDDLLRRQMSMRGEAGVTVSHRKRWYTQAWLLLGLAGLLGAVVSWAVIEPAFDDLEYLQGAITAVDPTDTFAQALLDRSGGERGIVYANGSVTINREKIYLFNRTKWLNADGSRPIAAKEEFAVGQRVGVHLDTIGGENGVHALAMYVDPAPPAKGDTTATIEQLLARNHAASLVFFGVVAGFIGLFVGAADGIVCRLPRRALLGGGVGLVVGLAGGFIASIFANLAYAPLTELAHRAGTDANGLTAIGFVIQIAGRAIAWCVAGCAMGLGQGIALRSKRLLLYGLVGGLVGGLFGGLLFDPIDLLLLGRDRPSGMWSRLVSIATIGLFVGAMIGIVELLARNAWLRMTQGPLTGKEFLIFKDVMSVGASPRSEIYLFNDPGVAPNHALLRVVGDECEIEARDPSQPVIVNTRPIRRVRLRHGDNVVIGRTMFVYQRRKT